jgi:hypothetical protein
LSHGCEILQQASSGFSENYEGTCLEGEKYYNEIILKAKADHTEKLLKGGAKIIAIDNSEFQEKMLSIADKLEDTGHWRKGLFKEVMSLK